MNLSNEQKRIVETNSKKVLVVAGPGAGKALENGSIVYTNQGPTIIEQLKINDKIFGEDGQLYKIIGIYPQGKKKKFIVKFTDGTSISCCDEHLWSFQTRNLRKRNSKTLLTKTLREIINDYPIFIKTEKSEKVNCERRRNIFIPMTEPVQFDKKDFQIPPYSLGSLLGDGSLGGVNRQTTFTNEDKDVVMKLQQELSQLGWTLKQNSEIEYSILQNSQKGQIGPLTFILNELKLSNTTSGTKFIPDCYKYSSIEDRLELLKGLIDTDGFCEGSSYDYVSKSKQLVLDVKEVCESLGLTAVYSEKKSVCYNSPIGIKDCGVVYRLRIKTSKTFPKLHYSLKREQQWKPSRVYAHRAIEEIIETDEFVEMTCIKIDNPTSLFLTNNFIVTHNTRTLIERINYLLKIGVPAREIVAITFTNFAAQEMLSRIQNKSNELFIGTIHSYANQILLKNGVDTHEMIEREDFDKLLDLATKAKKESPKYLLIDEFQDLCNNEYNFILSLHTENFMAIGDDDQCQPAGAKVLLKTGETKNIEDIKVGDFVAGSNISDNGRITSCGNRAIGYEVLKVSERDYCNDYLYTITTEKNNTSSYTSNHIHYIRMKDNIDEKYICYLMRNEKNYFRVGMTKIYSTHSHGMFGLRHRLRQENCSDGWILGVFDTAKEARVKEIQISTMYQIPQIIFDTDKTSFTEEDIDIIYSNINSSLSAENCLKDHKKNINYPLLSKYDNKHFARNATVEIYACNIDPLIMDVIEYDENDKNKKRISTILNIEYIYINEKIKVYSLEVDKVHNYIADGILTHNCIYDFKGANVNLFFNLLHDSETTKYYLEDNYRSGNSVIKFANNFLDDLEKRCDKGVNIINKKPGSVFFTSYKDAIDNIFSDYKDWFILTRTNAELSAVADYLKSLNIPYDTFKKGDYTYEEVNQMLDRDSVKLLTIHSAKGLEADNVIVVGGNEWNDSEKRICFVAATRAKNTLYWCDKIKKQKKKTFKNNTCDLIQF